MEVTRNLSKIERGLRDREVMEGYMDLFLKEHVLQFSAQYRSIMGGYTNLLKIGRGPRDREIMRGYMELIKNRAWPQRP